MKIKIPIYIVNAGDGSAFAVVCKTFEDAESIEELDPYSDGWAEPSADVLEVEIDEEGNILSGTTLEMEKKEWEEDA